MLIICKIQPTISIALKSKHFNHAAIYTQRQTHSWLNVLLKNILNIPEKNKDYAK